MLTQNYHSVTTSSDTVGVKFSSFLVPCLVFAAAAFSEDITPHIADIEIYGARKVPLQKIKTALGTKDGDPLPSREDAEDRIDRVPGVLASRVEAACCERKNMILYVGVIERDAPHFEFHPAPSGSATLPEDLVDNYRRLLNNTDDSLRAHNADEDLTNGYSLMADPDSRETQLAFLPMVAECLRAIDSVIHESADPEQRLMAAYLLQYAPRDARSSKVMINDLQYALQDREDRVRDAALQSLRAVYVGARLHPEQELRIEPTWLVELLNSVVWSDRHSASLELVDLTDKHDPNTLALIRERALPSVIEMARWRDLNHALPAFILAGRMAGLDEKQIQDAWTGGNRETVLEKVQYPEGKKSGIRSMLHRQSKKSE